MSLNELTRRPLANITQKIQVICKLYPYLWPKNWSIRLRLLLAGSLLLASIGLNVGVPLIFRKTINAISLSPTPVLLAELLLVTYGLVWTLAKVVEHLRFIAMYKVEERGIRLLCLDVFSHLLQLSFRFHTDRKTGIIASAIDRAQRAFPRLIWGLFFLIAPTLIEVIIAATILIILYGWLYGAILVVILALYVAFSVIGSGWSAQAQRDANDKAAQTTHKIIDSLLNYETIRYFGNQEYERNRCDFFLSEREKTAIKRSTYSEWVTIGQTLFMGAGLIILTVLSGIKVMSGAFHIGDFILINGYLLQFMIPLGYFGNIFRDIYQSVTDFEEVLKLLKLKPEIQDRLYAKDLIIKNGAILFDHVDFSYDLRRPILKNLSFEILPQKTTAIVGATGSGKSTIANLLFRYYDVLKGQILIDGQDIRSVTQFSLQSLIGVVPQSATLFNDTLLYNIAYGRPSASEEEIKKAIQDAHLDHFVASLPDGLNTLVGEHGLKLSGGERQRVAIARVLLKRPAIFIFDEATSSLDTKTEMLIQQNILEISSHATTLIIAHRLSTIVHADQILVLDHGHLAEQGTHSELLNRKGIYTQLWEKQTRTNKN